ncbi:MAG: aldehyde dehydrogenase family protein [Herpetosiphonaceae bacterium]|nr:aldehyde dehydrogenase family protein [Herpetosiphonaceae bacterium]
MTNAYKNYIGGTWVTASDGATFPNHNPANDFVVGTFPKLTREDTQLAIRAAHDALPAWANTPPPARGAILDKASQIISSRVDEIATVLTREEGKTRAEARGEVMRARDILRYYSGEGWRGGGDVLPSNTTGELLYSKREPLGVVSIITPWNFPIAIPTWKIAPALAFGNTIIFKPASDAPQTGLMLVEALIDAGLPAGVLNFVTGSGGVVGDELASSVHVQGLSFTGSTAVGSGIYGQAIKNFTRVQLEMGGKNALVVLADADLDVAVSLTVAGGFGLTGQACTATSRVIAEQSIADEFVRRLADAARKLKVGDGLQDGIQMGPAVNRSQWETDLHYIEVGRSEEAQLVVGGSPLPGSGLFVQPTVFDHVEPQMTIAQEEIFGPVISVLRARDFDHALELANAVPYGLTAGVVTNDLHKAFAFANAIDAGVVKINEPTTGLALQAPFGGFKQSSANTFKEQGQAAVEFYTRTKTIYIGHG